VLSSAVKIASKVHTNTSPQAMNGEKLSWCSKNIWNFTVGKEENIFSDQ